MATEKGQKDKQLSTKHAVKNKTDTIWRYQSGNQNPYIEEQTTQWPKEKGQKNKQWSKIEMLFTMTVKTIGLMIIPCKRQPSKHANTCTVEILTSTAGTET
jgi:hypothetical protein